MPIVQIFWPTKPNPEQSTLARLGRATHLLFIGLAILALIGGVAVSFSAEHGILRGVALGLCWAVPIALIGRGIRYVLSAE